MGLAGCFAFAPSARLPQPTDSFWLFLPHYGTLAFNHKLSTWERARRGQRSWQAGRALRARYGGSRCIGTRPTFFPVTDALHSNTSEPLIFLEILPLITRITRIRPSRFEPTYYP
jgi:hypothetical protein